MATDQRLLVHLGALVIVMGAVAAAQLLRTPQPHPPPTPGAPSGRAPDEPRARVDRDQERREARLRSTGPDIGEAEMERLIDESDLIVARLKSRGVTDVGLHIRHLLAEMEPTESELRAYYEAHRRIFGNRDFERSRDAVDRLVRIQMVREELGIEAATD